MSQPAGATSPAEAMILGRPLTGEHLEPDVVEERKVRSTDSNPDPPTAEFLDTHNPTGAKVPESYYENTLSSGLHQPGGEQVGPMDSQIADQEEGHSTPSASSSNTSSQAQHSPSLDQDSVGQPLNIAVAAQEKELSGEGKGNAVIDDNVNALLNLPPPLPFDLKVSNLWVGVPHRGPSS